MFGAQCRDSQQSTNFYYFYIAKTVIVTIAVKQTLFLLNLMNNL